MNHQHNLGAYSRLVDKARLGPSHQETQPGRRKQKRWQKMVWELRDNLQIQVTAQILQDCGQGFCGKHLLQSSGQFLQAIVNERFAAWLQWKAKLILSCFTTRTWLLFPFMYLLIHNTVVPKCFHTILLRLAQLVIDFNGKEVLVSRCQADRDAEMVGEI